MKSPSIAQESKQGSLFPSHIDGHRLYIIGGIHQKLRHERLREQDELVLLVSLSYGIEYLKEHRHIA